MQAVAAELAPLEFTCAFTTPPLHCLPVLVQALAPTPAGNTSCVISTQLLNGSASQFDLCTVEGVAGGIPPPNTVASLYPVPAGRCVKDASNCGKQLTQWTCSTPTTPACTCSSGVNGSSSCVQVGAQHQGDAVYHVGCSVMKHIVQSMRYCLVTIQLRGTAILSGTGWYYEIYLASFIL